VVAHPSAWEELRDAFLASTSGVVGRWFRAPLVALGLSAFYLGMLSLRFSGGVTVLGWVVLASMPGLYVRRVRGARDALRRAVLEGAGEAERAVPGALGRVNSLLFLRDAFHAACRRETEAAEAALREVDRSDLGPWELRVFEAVRVLLLIERGEQARASRLAPLALPTGDAALDRRLGCLMVRSSWEDEARLAAIEPLPEGTTRLTTVK